MGWVTVSLEAVQYVPDPPYEIGNGMKMDIIQFTYFTIPKRLFPLENYLRLKRKKKILELDIVKIQSDLIFKFYEIKEFFGSPVNIHSHQLLRNAVL